MHRILIFFLALSAISCSTKSQKLTLEQKAGQMLMIGFRDTIITDQSHILKDIQQSGIGGVILYEYDAPTKARPRNITSRKQLEKLCQNLQEAASIPLFIGIDEEGGRVSRLKPRYGFPPTVAPQYLGDLHNPDSSRLYAEHIASNCSSVGINLNFAPLADMNINPECPVIGALERSYSAQPDSVVKEAGIFIQAHQQQKVWCSLKHFPGHGSARSDSHQGFTNVTDSWTIEELEPYQQLIARELCPMVMTAHTFNANLDTVYPATLSKNTLALLRDSLHYDGLVLSDDMMMLAIADHYGLEEAIERALNAGVDVLLFSNNIDHYDAGIAPKARAIICKLVREGKVPEARIEEAYARIMRYKKEM